MYRSHQIPVFFCSIDWKLALKVAFLSQTNMAEMKIPVCSEGPPVAETTETAELTVLCCFHDSRSLPWLSDGQFSYFYNTDHTSGKRNWVETESVGGISGDKCVLSF